MLLFKFFHHAFAVPNYLPHIRFGLRIQIALIGIFAVVLTGAICLVGLSLEGEAQRQSDQAVKLRQHVVGLSANYPRPARSPMNSCASMTTS
jgi:methyl-accepting chemotaxis protein